MPEETVERAARWRRVRELFDEVVGLTPAARAGRLEAEPDRGLATDVGELLAAHDAADDRLAGAVWQDLEGAELETGGEERETAPGTRLGPWRIEGIAGRGGMGVVYRARRDDGAFERKVAIKLIRGTFESRRLVARLEEERRLLAALDHPGIARLLDAGTTEDGLPYLVLEYVDGEPIDSWCASRSLPVVERLRLFLAVCDAVEHAHERLVLHRDLKPSNVLVDRDGRPRLLDFGIARLLDPATRTGQATTQTRAGFRALSIDYASPEQLRGEPLGTASDVFSLGVVLYQLLTGRLPHSGETDWPEARASKVETESPEPPSKVARRTPGGLPWKRLRGDLDAIVTRAIAGDRAARYATVAELADDLRRHLEGRPVRAQRPAAGYRFRRFVGRHRGAVAAGLLVAVALIAATVFSWRQATIAARERDLARERFEDVRTLAKVFLFDVHDAIAPLAGATAARELLAATGADYLDRLAGAATDDPAFLLELATGYERLAEIQGRPFGASRGDAGAALATYEKARPLFERLAVLGYPTPAGAAEALSRVDLAAAESRFAIGDVPGALDLASRGLDRLASTGPTDRFESRLLRARLIARQGFLTGAGGDMARGAELAQSAVEELDRLVGERPDDPETRRVLARVLTDQGSIIGNLGLPDGAELALASFERALAIDRRLAEERPLDGEVRRNLVRDYLMVGAAHAASGRFAAALPVYADGVAAARALTEADPADVEGARALGILASRHALTLVDLGRPDEALAALAGIPERIAELQRRTPDNIRLALTCAETWGATAEIHWQLADREALSAAARSRHRETGCAALGRAEPLMSDLLARGLLPASDGEEARRFLAMGAVRCADPGR